MTSIIKVDTLQKANGGTPTAADLGINTTGTVLQVVHNHSTVYVTNNSSSYSTELATVITPKSSTSTLLVQVSAYGSISLASSWSLMDVTIYDSNSADDITMGNYETGVAGVTSARFSINRTAYVSSVSTAPRTFSIRYRKHGGVYGSNAELGRRVMTITEIEG